MPGIGKSQLVIQHANLAFNARVYSHVFWVSASTVASLSQGLVRILFLLNHTDRNHPDQAAQLLAVRLWFEQSNHHGCLRWLLILDNVSVESARFLRDHLPTQNASGRILVTTLTRNIAESVANVAGQKHPTHELKALSEAHSANLLLSKAGIQTSGMTDLASAEKLVSRMRCLPLAVEIAGSFMKRSGFKNANQGHTSWVRSIAFSPDGKHMISGSDDQTLRLWNAETGKGVGVPLQGHVDEITSVTFSPDGMQIASTARDNTIRIWAASEMVKGNSTQSSPPLQHICFSSNPLHTLREARSLFEDAPESILNGNWNDSITIQKDGWVLGPQGRLLFWVPHNHLPGFFTPRTQLLVGGVGTELDLSRFDHGLSWQSCRETNH